MLTNEEHHARPEIGSTTAKKALVSKLAFEDCYNGLARFEESSAMKLGTLCHTLILEPETVAEKWHSHGPINERTGKPYGIGTKAHEAWEAENPGSIIVPNEVRLMLDRMPEPVREIFAQESRNEHSFFADIGVSAKARPDHLTYEFITDLKTIDEIENIDRAIAKWNYPFSLEWYQRVMFACDGKKRGLRWIFAEKNSPYRWRIVTPDWDWQHVAAMEVDTAIQVINSPASEEDIYLVATPPAWKEGES